MSNDPKQQPAPVQTKPKPPDGNGREPIPVGIIRTHRPANFPGAEAEMSLRAKKEGHKEWTIQYLPWMRSFMVTFLRQEHPPMVRYLPEGGVESWDPPA